MTAPTLSPLALEAGGNYGGECTDIGCTCRQAESDNQCRFSADEQQQVALPRKSERAISTGVAVTVSLLFLALLAWVFHRSRERPGQLLALFTAPGKFTQKNRLLIKCDANEGLFER